MILLDIPLNPVNKMVFECTLDDLVKKIGSQKLMNVGPRKCHCKWLPADCELVSELSSSERKVMSRTYDEIPNDPVVIP
jgi:hypothetical protein